MLAALSAYSAATAAASDFTPAFFWSQREVGFGRNAEHLHTVSSQDLEGAVDAITGHAKGKKSALLQSGEHPAPEVQLVFLADDLHTETVREHGAGLKNLDHLLQTSTSSLSVPFTTRSADVPRMFDGATRVAAGEAEKYLTEHATLYHNGVPDVLVVELKAGSKEALTAVDGLIGRISHVVARGTSGNYAAMLTGLQRVASGDQLMPRGRALASVKQFETMPYLHMTPVLLTAYMVCGLLFTIFISGFCCLFSLQTPKKFEEVKAA